MESNIQTTMLCTIATINSNNNTGKEIIQFLFIPIILTKVNSKCLQLILIARRNTIAIGRTNHDTTSMRNSTGINIIGASGTNIPRKIS